MNSHKKFGALLEEIFKKMGEGSKLKSLKLKNIRLTSIPPDIHSEAGKDLTSIDFEYVEIG